MKAAPFHQTNTIVFRQKTIIIIIIIVVEGPFFHHVQQSISQATARVWRSVFTTKPANNIVRKNNQCFYSIVTTITTLVDSCHQIGIRPLRWCIAQGLQFFFPFYLSAVHLYEPELSLQYCAYCRKATNFFP
jgi:hypothetical protein